MALGAPAVVLAARAADGAAAARAGGCLQVVGCTGAGILTEEEWVLDSPGAAALVLTR